MKKKSILLFIVPVIGVLFLMSCNKDYDLYDGPDAFVEKAELITTGISSEDLKRTIDTAETYMLIDVREPNEHHPGYIPGSLNIPRGVIEFKMLNSDFWEANFLYLPLKEDLIIVYCKKGSRGILVAETLGKMGFTNVVYLNGGFKSWEMTYPNDYEHDEINHAAAEEEVGGC